MIPDIRAVQDMLDQLGTPAVLVILDQLVIQGLLVTLAQSDTPVA